MHKISYTITTDLCNKELIDLFIQVSQNSDSIFFGITSDIDNLGMYVANYGRAQGQNLVDFYTNVIGLFLSEQQYIDGNSLVFIPAGEETSIFGYSNSIPKIDKFFSELKNIFKNKSYPKNILKYSNTSVSFGLSYYSKNELIQVNNFVHYYKDINESNYAIKYFSLLKLLREKIAVEIDKEKFLNLNVEGSHIIMVRNIIFSQLIDYKLSTMRLLKQIIPLLIKIKAPNIFSTKYGLNKKKYLQLKDNINELSNKLWV